MKFHTVTVDFDECLTMPLRKGNIWESSEIPNTEFIDFLRKMHSDGIFERIIIVTSRKLNLVHEINEFIQRHDLDFVFAVKCTDGDWKAKMLNEVDSQLHFDDDVDEAQVAKHDGFTTILIPHPVDVLTNVDGINDFEHFNQFKNRILKDIES